MVSLSENIAGVDEVKSFCVVVTQEDSFDFSISSGKDIPIEERNPDEVRMVQGIYIAPKNIPVYNPSFDITPNELITGIITEKGALKAPYYISIKQFERSLKYE